jgi:hypothetical protein
MDPAIGRWPLENHRGVDVAPLVIEKELHAAVIDIADVLLQQWVTLVAAATR